MPHVLQDGCSSTNSACVLAHFVIQILKPFPLKFIMYQIK